jgi:hypothetical protein
MNCFWRRWEHAPALLFECMPTGNNGLCSGVQVGLSYSKVHAEDCSQCDTKDAMVDRIAIRISFTGDLSADQKNRLLEIANKCPVHRTLVSKVQIEAVLLDADALTRSS